jgi:hypothetical protein
MHAEPQAIDQGKEASESSRWWWELIVAVIRQIEAVTHRAIESVTTNEDHGQQELKPKESSHPRHWVHIATFPATLPLH